VKRLWLMRHAKSSWDDPTLADRIRPLAPRGIRATKALRRHLEGTGIAPSLVLCSPAVRAASTWEGVSAGVPSDVAVEIDETVYHGDEYDLLWRLRQVATDVESVLVVGHNPTLHELAVGLAGAGDAELRSRLVTKFPTGALATLDAPGEWRELEWGRGTLVDYVVPRDL
jgi:phosphohistidine phosphatase